MEAGLWVPFPLRKLFKQPELLAESIPMDCTGQSTVGLHLFRQKVASPGRSDGECIQTRSKWSTQSVATF